MKLSIVLSLLFISFVHASVIQPLPTRTADSAAVLNKGSPTAAPSPHFIKRDLEDTLSLYENWANDCNSGDDNNNAKIAVSDLNNLWQTVTSTVYCGNGRLRTVTKTVTATKSTTTTKSSGGSGGSKGGKKTQCDDKCWSTYLWRKWYFSVALIFYH
jgi:hypothetical protein